MTVKLNAKQVQKECLEELRKAAAVFQMKSILAVLSQAPARGDSIKDLIRQIGTQSAVAKRLGVGERTVRRWIAEDSTPPLMVREIKRLAGIARRKNAA